MKSISVNGGIKDLQQQAGKLQTSVIGALIETSDVKERFNKMLGSRSGAFLSSLLTLCNSTPALQKCKPATVLSAAATAASLNLSINPSLGQSYIIPYGDTASWQIGYKGLIQLAMRSGQMKSIIVCPVYDGELQDFNRFTETFTPGEKKSDKIVGYYASFELINGFHKCVYWKEEAVLAHAKKFSKTFNNGAWKTDPVAMCQKTVLKSLLSTFAPLSIDMQMGISNDEDAKPITDANEPTEQIETVDVVASTPAFEEVPNDGELTAKEQQEILDAMEDK